MQVMCMKAGSMTASRMGQAATILQAMCANLSAPLSMGHLRVDAGCGRTAPSATLLSKKCLQAVKTCMFQQGMAPATLAALDSSRKGTSRREHGLVAQSPLLEVREQECSFCTSTSFAK